MKKVICLILTIIVMFSLSTQTIVMASSHEIKVTVNGSKVDFPDVQPQLINGRTLVPLRAVFEKMGCNVEWNQKNKSALISFKGNTLLLRINNSSMVLNNTNLQRKLDVPAQLISSRTMIPLRYAAEALGFNVQWDNSSKTVIVSGNGIAPNEAYVQAESIFKAIGANKTTAGDYFKSGLSNVGALNTSLSELKTAHAKADAMYAGGFLIIDCVNIATGISKALQEGSEEVFESIIDAQETMYEYSNSTESMTVQDYFISSGKASFYNYIKLSEYMLNMHLKRIEKKYFTNSEAVAYATCYNLMMIDRKTLSTAVELLINEAPDGLIDGMLLTGKRFTFNLIPGSLGDNLDDLLDLNSEAIDSYYAAVNQYKSNLKKLLY